MKYKKLLSELLLAGLVNNRRTAVFLYALYEEIRFQRYKNDYLFLPSRGIFDSLVPAL